MIVRIKKYSDYHYLLHIGYPGEIVDNLFNKYTTIQCDTLDDADKIIK